MKSALQLWSVQDSIKNDFLGTLRKVSEMGYQGVEFAGYFDVAAAEIKQALDELNLTAAASHIPYQQLFENLEATLAFEKTLGNQNIVIPYATFETQAEWQHFFQQIKVLASKIQQAGFQLYYHNHAHEFSEIPEFDVLEAMLAAVPELKVEVDLYWLAYAEKDVIQWLNNHKKRLGLLHIKDMQDNPQESTIIGQGHLPIAEYVAFAKEQQLPWLIVEQEAFQGIDPLVAVAKGYQNLKTYL